MCVCVCVCESETEREREREASLKIGFFSFLKTCSDRIRRADAKSS